MGTFHTLREHACSALFGRARPSVQQFLVTVSVCALVGGTAYQVFTSAAQEPMPAPTSPPPSDSTYTPPPTYTSPPPSDSYTAPTYTAPTYTAPHDGSYNTAPYSSGYTPPYDGSYNTAPYSGGYTAPYPSSGGSYNTAPYSGGYTAPYPYPGGGSYSMPSGSGTCDQQPNWPDCASFSCTNGNWACTSMKSTSGGYYSSGGMYSAPGTSSCTAGCSQMTDMNARDACYKSCSGSYQTDPNHSAASSYSLPSMPDCAPGVMPTAANPCRMQMQFDGGYHYSSMPGGYNSSMRPCGPNEYPTPGNPCSGGGYSAPGGTQGGASQCFADCTRGISGSDPAYAACSQKCYGGDQGGTMPGGYNNYNSMRPCGPNEYPTPQNPCTSGGMNTGGYQPPYPGYGNQYGFPGMHGADIMPYPYYGDQQRSPEDMQKAYGEQQKRMAEELKQRAGSECQRLMDPIRSAYGLSPDMKQSIETQLKALVADCESSAKNIASDGGDSQSFYEKMNGYQQQIGTIFQASASCGGVESAIRGMTDGVKSASSHIAQVAQQNPTLAAQMKDLQARTLAGVQEAQQQFKSGDCEAASQTMQQLQQTMQNEMRSWDMTGGRGNFSFVDERSMAKDFSDKLKKKGIGFSADQLLQHGYNDYSRMTAASDVLFFVNDEDAAEYFLNDEGSQNMLDLFLSDEEDNDGEDSNASLIAKLIEENARLRSQVQGLESQLSAMQFQLAQRLNGLTIDPSMSDRIVDFMEHELPNAGDLTPKQMDEIYLSFKLQNGQALLENGLTPFVDVDPSEWFADEVSEAKKTEIMKGNEDGTFAAEKPVNNAEAAVTLARALGVEPIADHSAISGEFGSYPAWAQPYVAAMDEAGVDLSELSSDPGEAMTKSDLASFLADNLLPENVEIDGAKEFTDLGSLSHEEQESIAKLSALGIVNGEAGSDSFNPDATVNRAVFAKMVTQTVEEAHEILDHQ